MDSKLVTLEGINILSEDSDITCSDSDESISMCVLVMRVIIYYDIVSDLNNVLLNIVPSKSVSNVPSCSKQKLDVFSAHNESRSDNNEAV